ncbi:MAG TPA: isocitrate lyase/PEP mutase family protein [Stellaceae bacterium]|nr:isocitrate lyase/PEP mutase family protein [Stellaceae bacterium]
MTATPSNAAKLRALLRQDEMLVAPAAYDCVGARAIEDAGFPLVYMTGSGTAAMLGYPDYGLVTMSEMVDNAGRIAAAVKAPVIADADTGYGNELNVTRTVQEYARRGVAGLHIEDQTFPKKCGQLDDKEVIPAAEFIAKVKAAVAARPDPDFVIIARTDARAVLGLDEAALRMNAALEAGADIAFLEAPQNLDEIKAVPKLVRGPCLLNLSIGGRTPLRDLREAERAGYRIVIVPGLLLQEAMRAFAATLAELKQEHRLPEATINVRERLRRMGAPEWDALRDRFKG